MRQYLKSGLVITAFASYIIGGVQTFFGLALLFFFDGRTIGAWGSSRSIGILLICTGLGLSVLGVLLLRIYQNRN